MVDSSVFEDRTKFVMWATVQLLVAMDLRQDTNAHENARTHAIKVADLFFKKNGAAAGQQNDPASVPPAIRPPPGPRVVGPAVPGQKVNTTTPGTGTGAETDGQG